jgi:hypothetical protein
VIIWAASKKFSEYWKSVSDKSVGAVTFTRYFECLSKSPIFFPFSGEIVEIKIYGSSSICFSHFQFSFYINPLYLLIHNKTVVPYHPYCRDLPRSAPQAPLIPGYPPCCRNRRKVS